MKHHLISALGMHDDDLLALANNSCRFHAVHKFNSRSFAHFSRAISCNIKHAIMQGWAVVQFDGTSNGYVHIQAQLCVSAVVKQVQNCTHNSCSCEVKTYPEPHDMVHTVTPCSADGCSGYNTQVLSYAKMRRDIVAKGYALMTFQRKSA